MVRGEQTFGMPTEIKSHGPACACHQDTSRRLERDNAYRDTSKMLVRAHAYRTVYVVCPYSDPYTSFVLKDKNAVNTLPVGRITRKTPIQ